MNWGHIFWRCSASAPLHRMQSLCKPSSGGARRRTWRCHAAAWSTAVHTHPSWVGEDSSCNAAISKQADLPGAHSADQQRCHRLRTSLFPMKCGPVRGWLTCGGHQQPCRCAALSHRAYLEGGQVSWSLAAPKVLRLSMSLASCGLAVQPTCTSTRHWPSVRPSSDFGGAAALPRRWTARPA